MTDKSFIPHTGYSPDDGYDERVAMQRDNPLRPETPFDPEAYLALGRANRDALPTAVAEALGEPRDWAGEAWRGANEAWNNAPTAEQGYDYAAAFIRANYRPIGKDVTDETVHKELRRVASIFAQWRSTLMLQKMDGEQWRALNKSFDDLAALAEAQS